MTADGKRKPRYRFGDIVMPTACHGSAEAANLTVPWKELDRRKAVAFVHPGKPAIPIIDGIPGPIVDYPFDTTRTAVQLVLNGVTARYKQVCIILSHAGGFLPYASLRFSELAAAVRVDAPSPEDILKEFQRFYFDTALSSGPAALPSLQVFTAPGHILYGSDSLAWLEHRA
jgi:predicted TIM-barrel fold metal-dependent hydrolase